MPDITTTFYIPVICDDCGKELVAEYDSKKDEIRVTPCVECLKESESSGYQKGYKDAVEIESKAQQQPF